MTPEAVEAVLKSYPANLPRYTSYPPANHFSPDGGARQHDSFVAAVQAAELISAYIHVPFCDRLCWFCGCHTKQTLKYAPVRAFVDTLIEEIGLWKKHVGSRKMLSRLHLGGGSPSLLKAEELTRLRQAITTVFDLTKGAEISIEIDPSDVSDASIAALKEFGMTRASIGVQDFDPDVQKAINRPQSFELTKRVVTTLRASGLTSLNIDALYGLPLQTEARLKNTLQQVIQLKPDRIALFGYAHVPWLKPHQNLIADRDLPGPEDRLRHAMMARDMMCAAGYLPIGIDHFALPADTLAQKSAAGELQRNFQGYTDDAASVLLPLGPSSIGRHPGGFVQNEIATGRYTHQVTKSEFAFARGLGLTSADKAEAWVIERLMCDFAFDIDEAISKFGPDAGRIVAIAQHLSSNDRSGAITIMNRRFTLQLEAWPLARAIASRFDAWLDAGERGYSKAV